MMARVLPVLVVASTAALVAATLLAAGMLVLGYRGRPIPGWMLPLVAGLIGAAGSTDFILFITAPIGLALGLLLPAISTYYLVRRRRWRALGVLLLALGLPGAAWWGYFLVKDAADATVSYDPVLWLWFAPALALVVVGVALVVIGDGRPAPDTAFPPAAGHARDPVAIATALGKEIKIGPLPMPGIIADGAGIALLIVVYSASGALGLPAPVGVIAGTAVYVVISTALWVPAIPRRAREAWEGFATVGNPAFGRFRTVTGTTPPATLGGVRRWLRNQPDLPQTRWARAEMLVVAGELDQARGVVERMPIETDWDRFEQRALRAYIEWTAGGDIDLESLRDEAARVGQPGSDERRQAEGEAMLAIARDRASAGGDWMAPLRELRAQAGPAAGRMLRKDIRRTRTPKVVFVGLAASIGLLLLDLATTQLTSEL